MSSITITSTVKVYTPGKTIEFTKVNGDLTRCMAKEHSLGPMEENMLVNMLKIRREDTVSLYGQMVDATEANGSMVSNMARVPTSHKTDKKNMVNGKTEKG